MSENRRRRSRLTERLEGRQLFAGQIFASEGPALNAAPIAVAVADFDADGRRDVVTANLLTSSLYRYHVSLALARADGRFGSVTGFPLPNSDAPAAMAVSDVDADGRPDLVLACINGSSATSGSVAVLRNLGNGRFDFGSTYPIAGRPSAITVGDFNHDAKPDLAVSNVNLLGGNGGLSVLINQGGGAFKTPVTTPLPYSLRDVAARDLNADGKLDLVAAADYGSAGLVVLNGVGNGTFAAPVAVPDTTSTAYGSVAVGDFNGDAVPDLAAGKANESGLTIHFGAGNGTFAAPVGYAGTTAARLVVADLNADGKSDLLATSFYADAVTVLLNDGSGAFTSRAIPAGDGPSGVAVADLTGDGLVDLAVASRFSESVAILPGRGGGDFATQAASPASGTGALTPDRAVTGDFTGDGVTDLALANTNNGNGASTSSIAVRPGNGDGTFAEPLTRYTIDGNPTAPVTGDFNGDGRLDLAVASGTSSSTTVLLGRGDGTFAAPIKTTSGGQAKGLAALDFDNNGKTDLAVATTSGVALLRGRGDGRFNSLSLGFSITPTAITTADFNRDNNADLAIADNNGVTPLLGRGDGTFAAGAETSVGLVPNAIAAGDLTGDGVPDVAVTHANGNYVTPLRTNGGGAFVSEGLTPTVPTPVGLTIADFDGDGVGDLAVLGLDASYVHLRGVYGLPPALAGGDSSSSITAGDFTGDGRIDLLTTAQARVVVSPNLTRPADAAVSVAGGVLTIGPGSATLAATAGVTRGLTVTTAAGVTRLSADAITRVVLSGATLALNADLGRLAGRAVNLTVDDHAAATFATTQHLGTLDVNGTATLAAGGGKVLRTTGLSLGATGRLDLADNDLIYDYTGTAPQAATVRGLIAAARGTGQWTGPGLTSFAARTDATGTTTLGYLEASDYQSIHGVATFAGETIDDTAVLVRYTLYGDTDLDTGVSINDFNRLSSGFGGGGGKLWLDGDFDLDNGVSINDFNLLSANFGKTLPAVTPLPAAKKGVAPAKR